MSIDLHTGLNEAAFASIGRISVAHSYLEGGIEYLIAALSRLKQEDLETFIGRTMFDGKLTILEGLILARLTKRKKRATEFKAIFSEIRILNSSRKIAIHGMWAAWASLRDLAEAKDPLALQRSRKIAAVKFEKGKKKQLTMTEATGLANKIMWQHRALYALVDKTWTRQSLMSRSERAALRALMKHFPKISSETKTSRHPRASLP